MKTESITVLDMKEFVILSACAFAILALVALFTSSRGIPYQPKGGVDSPDDSGDVDFEWGAPPGSGRRFAGREVGDSGVSDEITSAGWFEPTRRG